MTKPCYPPSAEGVLLVADTHLTPSVQVNDTPRSEVITTGPGNPSTPLVYTDAPVYLADANLPGKYIHQGINWQSHVRTANPHRLGSMTNLRSEGGNQLRTATAVPFPDNPSNPTMQLTQIKLRRPVNDPYIRILESLTDYAAQGRQIARRAATTGAPAWVQIWERSSRDMLYRYPAIMPLFVAFNNERLRSLPGPPNQRVLVTFHWWSLRQYNEQLAKNVDTFPAGAVFLAQRTLNPWNCVWAMCTSAGSCLFSYDEMTESQYYIVTPEDMPSVTEIVDVGGYTETSFFVPSNFDYAVKHQAQNALLRSVPTSDLAFYLAYYGGMQTDQRVKVPVYNFADALSGYLMGDIRQDWVLDGNLRGLVHDAFFIRGAIEFCQRVKIGRVVPVADFDCRIRSLYCWPMVPNPAGQVQQAMFVPFQMFDHYGAVLQLKDQTEGQYVDDGPAAGTIVGQAWTRVSSVYSSTPNFTYNNSEGQDFIFYRGTYFNAYPVYLTARTFRWAYGLQFQNAATRARRISRKTAAEGQRVVDPLPGFQ